MYSISVKLGDQVYESSGETMRDCLLTMPKPAKVTLKAVVTIKKGEKSYEALWMPVRLKKLWYKDAPTYLAKQFEVLVA